MATRSTIRRKCQGTSVFSCLGLRRNSRGCKRRFWTRDRGDPPRRGGLPFRDLGYVSNVIGDLPSAPKDRKTDSMKVPANIQPLIDLLRGGLNPPPGPGRIALAVIFGVIVHAVFAVAVFVATEAAVEGATSRLPLWVGVCTCCDTCVWIPCVE